MLYFMGGYTHALPLVNKIKFKYKYPAASSKITKKRKSNQKGITRKFVICQDKWKVMEGSVNGREEVNLVGT